MLSGSILHSNRLFYYIHQLLTTFVFAVKRGVYVLLLN